MKKFGEGQQPFKAIMDIPEGDAQELTTVTDQALNSLYGELFNLLQTHGINPTTTTSADLKQVARAVWAAVAAGNFYKDSGNANVKNLTHVKGGNFLFNTSNSNDDGFMVEFVNKTENTGAVTVNIFDVENNTNHFNNVALLDFNNNPLQAKDLPAKSLVTAVYNASTNSFNITNVTNVNIKDNKVFDENGVTQRVYNNASNAAYNFKFLQPATSGELSVSVQLQEFVNKTNNEKLSVLYIPTISENYLIDETIICEYPISIAGDKGANQDRYYGKKGNIIIGAANIAFKLGNGRDAYPEVTYIADQYNISNIGFLQKVGEPALSKTALQWYVKTNAPDRGLMLNEISANKLDKVFHLLNGADTDLANLTVQSSCLSNNNYVIYSEGALNGLSFTNNQAEQSIKGLVYGSFNGAVSITDNMIEGSKNLVTIYPAPKTGSRTKLNFERNYIEANYGDYLISFISTVDGHLTIKDNFHFDLNESEAQGKLKDIIRLGGGISYVNNVDDLSITLFGEFNVQAEPLFSKNNRYNIRINSNNLNLIKNVLLFNYDDKKPITQNIKYTKVLPKVKTNKGDIYYMGTFGNGIRHSTKQPVNAGDILKLTIAYYADGNVSGSNVSIGVNDETLTNGVSGLMYLEPSNGVIKVASFVFMAGFYASDLLVNIGISNIETYLLGVAVEKIGVSTANEDKCQTRMSMPMLYSASNGLEFTKVLDGVSGVVLNANSSALVTAQVSGVTAANKIKVSFRNPKPYVLILIESVTNDNITFRLFNLSTGTVNITNDILDLTIY